MPTRSTTAKTDSRERPPGWSEIVLQGLAFWSGYQRTRYPYHDLRELSLLDEVRSLIRANLGSSEVLLLEQNYAQIVQTGQWPSKLRPRAKADLVIAEKGAQSTARHKRPYGDRVIAAIEVKRATAPKAEIDEDLDRLANFKLRNSRARAFLLLAAEATLPERFVLEGEALRVAARKGSP